MADRVRTIPPSSSPTPVSPEASAGYQVRRAHRRFDRFLNACLSRHGVKTGFWYYLRVLWIRDGVSQKYLSDMTNVAENTTATIVNSMVEDGLVTRERDTEDRRRFSVLLTDRGRALEKKLMPYAAEINTVATEGIAEADLELCLSVLKRMSENLALGFDEHDKRPSEKA